MPQSYFESGYLTVNIPLHCNKIMDTAKKVKILAIITIFVIVKAQDYINNDDNKDNIIMFRDKAKPVKCYGTFELLEAFCCPIPPFFAKEIAMKCGVITGVFRSVVAGTNITNMARTALGCKGWICILVTYRLIEEKEGVGVLDEYKMYDHLDRWVDLNTDFKMAIFKAKIVCKEALGPMMPIEACYVSEYTNCIRNYLKLDCPTSVMLNSTKCLEQKAFYDECREYFY